MTITKKHHKIRAIPGIGISALFVWLAFRGTNWSEFIEAIQNVNYFILVVAMVLLVISVWIRATRWRLVLAFVTLAVIVPSAPGYIGTYQAAAIAALQIVYINVDVARAFALMYHLAQYIPMTFIGLYYFFKLNLHIADLDKVYAL